MSEPVLRGRSDSDDSGGGLDLDETLTAARTAKRAAGRAALGVTGEQSANVALRDVVRAGKGWYPISALGTLAIIDAFQIAVFTTLGPEIAETLGVDRGLMAGLIALRLLATFCSTLPVAAATQGKPRRAVIIKASALLWVATAFGFGLSRNAAVLAVWLVLGGMGNGVSLALHRPMVIDSYPPAGRVRMLAVYRSLDQVGNIAAPLMLAALTTFADLTWRGILMIIGALTIPAAIYALFLKDPGFGAYDEAVLKSQLRSTQGPPSDNERSDDLSGDDVRLGFFETIRRLMLIATVRRILIGWAVLGLSFVPLSAYLNFFLDERWGMGPGERALLSAALPLFSMAALAITSRRSESMLRADPATLLTRAAIGIGGGALSLSLVPLVPSGWFALMVAFLGGGFALQGIGFPALEASQLSIIPSTMRPHAAALAGIYLSAVGGIGGVLLFGSIDRRFGAAGVFLPVGILGVLAGLVLRSARLTVGPDLDRTVDTMIETEELRALHSRGKQLPMLTCRHINFSYGTVQVLFDVNFTVDEGEMVALLGTNGAGKSTLLRVVSGLGLPQSGTVRFRGQDITYIDAERRVAMGITQIPGGKAAFAPLTVVENLRVAGYTHGRNRKAVERGIEQSFAAFPRLAERRTQLAGTLSGGEQQMLALSKALILAPRLLVIDELSLGLAPKIVGELLDMVRQINANGTAVVLVEQSVNVALGLVNHAYFMEKGEVRFDGVASDLVQRDDLLRSVFLEGSAKALAT
jgi:ABC-type branched-subunit amino acid transport system ATPase component